MNFLSLANFLIIILITYSCKSGEGGADSADKAKKTSSTPMAVPATYEGEWLYQGYEMKDKKLLILRVKFDKTDHIYLEEYLFDKGELFRPKYRNNVAKLEKVGSTWTVTDVELTCGEKETQAMGIASDSEGVTLTDKNGVRLTFRKDQGYFRELFKQVMISELDSDCSMLAHYTKEEVEEPEEAVLPPFPYVQYQIPNWSTTDKELVKSIVESLNCQYGSRMHPVTFHIDASSSTSTISGTFMPGPHLTAPTGSMYVGVSAFNDVMFVQGPEGSGSYNVTMFYCLQKAGNGVDFVSDKRSLSGFNAANGITLNDSTVCGVGQVTSAQNTSLETQAYSVVVEGKTVSVPAAQLVTTFYPPRCAQ